MTKILRILNRFNIGGPTYNVSYLTKYLSNEYQTKLIGGQKEDSEASSEFIMKSIGVDYEIIPEIRREISLWQDFKAFCKIVKIIRHEKPQIVHTHASKAGMLGRAAAIVCRVPYIFHTFHGHVFHSYFGSAKTKFFITIERILARHSTAIIAISNRQKDELGNTFHICKPNKIEVVPLGFDLTRFQENCEEKRAEFRQRWQIADNEIAIGIVGRLAKVKNHTLFIDAIAQCRTNFPNTKIRAFIIGDGECLEELQTYCTSKNLAFNTHNDQNFGEIITFTSWIQNVDVAYAGLDIVALTSLNEGTPVSIIEAQAAGKPIVSTKVGGISDIVIENQTALLAELSVDDFAEKLSQLFDADFRHKMSQNSSQFSTQKFSLQRLCSDMEKVYEKYTQSN